MKISPTFPPNFELIKAAFPAVVDSGSIFCYGDTIFNPYERTITPDLECHEMVHQKQQGDFPDAWWNRYIVDQAFRLEQEIEAYGLQYLFVKQLLQEDQSVRGKAKLLDWFRGKFVEALSGETYGRMISYQEADSKLRHYAKNNE